jgi:hypothetical protein
LVAVVLAVLVLLAVRVSSSARSELDEARSLDGRGDRVSSIAHYRRAARMIVPLAPTSEEALTRLATIGTEAEEAGDLDLALSAWRSIRAAILGSRSFYVPFRDRLEEADRHIAHLMAQQPAAPIEASASPEEREAAHLALLEAEVGPSPWWSLVALAGLATWVSAAFLFATRAFGDDDALVPREARRWAGVFVVGFFFFALGLSLA